MYGTQLHYFFLHIQKEIKETDEINVQSIMQTQLNGYKKSLKLTRRRY